MNCGGHICFLLGLTPSKARGLGFGEARIQLFESLLFIYSFVMYLFYDKNMALLELGRSNNQFPRFDHH